MKLNTFLIKCLMAEKGISYKDVEAMTGLDASVTSHILKRGTCSIVNAGKIARALGVSVMDITVDDRG